MNEEANMRPLLDKIKASIINIDFEVIFVDDGSTDRTIEESIFVKDNILPL